MKIKIKPWKIKIKRKKHLYKHKKAVREHEAKMKKRKNMQEIRCGIVLLLAVILGVSSFVADYQMCVYAGTTEFQPEVSVIAETYAEETGTENSESLEHSQSMETENSEDLENTETVEDTQGKDETEYIAPDVKITITPQEGWHKDEAVVSVSAEDMLATGNFAMDFVKVKIGKNGSWMDITDDMRFVVSENCSVYVMITDKNGTTYEKTRYITCFDKTKPVLNAAVNGGLLSV